MCGRYRRTTKEEELARLYHIPIPKEPDLPISYNIAPSQNVLAIRYNPQTKERSLDQLRWGLIPYWAKDSKLAYRTINARTETVDVAPISREAVELPQEVHFGINAGLSEPKRVTYPQGD
jgi:putative SOS response-associated peptidase YedK